MIDKLLREITDRPMLHGCIAGTLGMTGAYAIWAVLSGWPALIAVLLWAAIVAGYVAGND